MACSTGTTATKGAVTDIVLVHGAFHGGWCWQRVRPLLERGGLRVHTPSLTGLAEKRHLLSRDITMETFVADVLDVLDSRDLRRAVLVGHSFGGRVVTGVADRRPERLAHLVYLDGGLSLDGRSRLESMRPEQRQARLTRAADHDGGTSVPPPPAQALGLIEPEDIQWVEDRLTPQPLGPEASRLPLRHEIGNGLPVTYLHCVAPPFGGVDEPAAYARSRPDWSYRRLSASHDAMVSEPRLVADALLDAARSAPTTRDDRTTESTLANRNEHA